MTKNKKVTKIGFTNRKKIVYQLGSVPERSIILDPVHPGWLLGIGRVYQKAVKHFETIMFLNGYRNFNQMIDDIEKSFDIFKRLFERYEIKFTEEIKTTVGLLQLSLVYYFRKLEVEIDSSDLW